MEKVIAYYDDYMTELATVKDWQPDGSVKSYEDKDLKQAIALNLLAEIITMDRMSLLRI